MTDRNDSLNLIGMVSEIVAAYVSNHQIESTELPELVKLVYRSLYPLSLGQSSRVGLQSGPFVPIEKSIQPDYIICLEDGRQLKMLKRHLKTFYNMTPNQYRERWGLPSNYPMVAPNYAAHRKRIAKSTGLGTHRKAQKRKVA